MTKKITVRGVCLLNNCDIGPLYALQNSIGPFEYRVSCKYVTSRSIGLIRWCKYNGDCDLIDIDYKHHMRNASQYTNLWKRKKK